MFKNVFKEKPYIRFDANRDELEVLPHPVKASKAMPEWYKKLKPAIKDASPTEAGTAKRCVPVLDAVSQGYIIPLWADLHVSVRTHVELFAANGNKLTEIDHIGDADGLVGKTVDDLEGQPKVARATRTGVQHIYLNMPAQDTEHSHTIGAHGWQQVGEACDLKKFKLGKSLMKFNNPWIIETSPGWSVQFKNPSSNWSNEINLIEGVVDTDEYYNEINFPFVWTGTEDCDVMIEKGTPLIQVIPFKREEMKLEFGVQKQKKKDLVSKQLLTKHFNKYRTLFWHKRKKD